MNTTDGRPYQHGDTESQFSEEEEVLTAGIHPSYLCRSFQVQSATTVTPEKTPEAQVPPFHSGPASAKISPNLGLRYDNKVQPRRLEFKRDTRAQTRWRNNEPPDGVFDLPVPYLEVISKLRTTKASGQGSGNVFEALTDIGLRTKTWIRAPIARDEKLYIWGIPPSHIENAKRALSEWLSPLGQPLRVVAPSTCSSDNPGRTRAREARLNLPSVHKITNKEKRKMEMDIEAIAKKETYRQEPKAGETFNATGSFLWPLNEIIPDELLGSGYAALDPLRTYHDCYITFDRRLKVFKILSNNGTQRECLLRIHAAMDHLRAVFSECVTRTSLPLELYLASLAASSSALTDIEMVDEEPFFQIGIIPTVIRGTGVASIQRRPRLIGRSLNKEEKRIWDKRREGLDDRNRSIMRNATAACLSRMVYHRGRITIRTHIGSFIFTRYFWPKNATSMPTEQFIQRIEESSTKGQIQQIPAPDQVLNNLFIRTCQATTLLEPMDTFSTNLEDVKPVFAALFPVTVKKAIWLKLTVEATSMGGNEGLYDIVSRQWTTHDNSNAAPLQLYSVPLTKAITWKLQISTDYHLDGSKTNAEMEQFQASIGLLAASGKSRSRGDTELMFEFLSEQPSFIQKTAWRYRLKGHGGYIFEIARYDNFCFKPGTSIPLSREPINTRWGGSLWSEAWDEKLSSNTSLKVGDRALWEPSLEEFFPTESTSHSPSLSPGFDNYLDNVQSIVNFLNETDI